MTGSAPLSAANGDLVVAHLACRPPPGSPSPWRCRSASRRRSRSGSHSRRRSGRRRRPRPPCRSGRDGVAEHRRGEAGGGERVQAVAQRPEETMNGSVTTSGRDRPNLPADRRSGDGAAADHHAAGGDKGEGHAGTFRVRLALTRTEQQLRRDNKDAGEHEGWRAGPPPSAAWSAGWRAGVFISAVLAWSLRASASIPRNTTSKLRFH